MYTPPPCRQPQFPVSPAAASVFGMATVFALWLAVGTTSVVAEEAEYDVATAEKRLIGDVEILAADDMEGRGVGTDGLNKAADYIKTQFVEAGLKTDLFDGEPFQTFTYTSRAECGPEDQNRLTLVAPKADDDKPAAETALKLGVDFTPLAAGGSGTFDLPIVFVGYGITAEDLDYDDYAGIDVEGKAVLILRKEPQQNDPKSGFDGVKASAHARYSRKIANAYQHGAAAIVFVNDDREVQGAAVRKRRHLESAVERLLKEVEQFKTVEERTVELFTAQTEKLETLAAKIRPALEAARADDDALGGFLSAGPGGDRDNLPVMFCTRASMNRILAAVLKTNLAALEREIDAGPAPKSCELGGWRIRGQATVQRREIEIKNVVGVLEGEGPLADETIVVGAHYDHIGLGGLMSSLTPWKRTVHNGADDNASGTAVIIEMARRLAAREKRLPRRVVFIAFTGEERGLLGSGFYANNPLFPIENTVAMFNFDMVGRQTDDKLILFGTGSAEQFDSLVEQTNDEYQFALTKKPSGFGPSDQASFYAKKVPVMHFFTGTHGDYHRPSDDVEKINVLGMRRIGQFATDILIATAEAADRPVYAASGGKPTRPTGGRPYLGTVPDFGRQVEGYAISGVAKDSPAEKASILPGDVIVRLGESKIGSLADVDGVLRKLKPGTEVPVVVLRDGKEVALRITPGPPK